MYLSGENPSMMQYFLGNEEDLENLVTGLIEGIEPQKEYIKTSELIEVFNSVNKRNIEIYGNEPSKDNSIGIAFSKAESLIDNNFNLEIIE